MNLINKTSAILFFAQLVTCFVTYNAVSQTEWIKYEGNPVLDLGLPGSWDSQFNESPSVIYDGNIYHMWYSGADDFESSEIGYATSPDGINWERYHNNPVLEGKLESWEEFGVFGPHVIWDGTIFYM